jgi:polysaccharide pyruvyl transferase WcaK-like protein
MLSSAEIQFALSRDPDATFCRQLEHLLADVRPTEPVRSAAWQAEPFRPLLLGYTGLGNVGADIRVREMVRQFQVIFGHTPLEPQLVVMGEQPIDPVLDGLGKVKLDTYFPSFLRENMGRVDGVIACEGSMFTSTFSDILSATFAAGIGYAARAGKLAVGYGAESGRMSERLTQFVQGACDNGLLLARSQGTYEQLTQLGLRTDHGADSAWTYEPGDAALAQAQERLRAAGWNGQAPVAVVCPINPFWWPVRIDAEKSREMQATGRHRDLHYHGLFFHAAAADAAERFDGYLASLVQAVEALRAQGYFPIVVGMERLDRQSCERLSAAFTAPLPCFISGDLAAQDIVALLHSASLVVTSRFHAAVLSLNRGVKTIGLAVDTRIRNLFSEHGLAPWFFACDMPELGPALQAAIQRIGRAQLQPTYAALVAKQIVGFGNMGMRLHDEVCRVYPSFPASPLARDWRAFLPPMSNRQNAMLDHGLSLLAERAVGVAA